MLQTMSKFNFRYHVTHQIDIEKELARLKNSPSANNSYSELFFTL